jgi:hypothetical protein
MEAESEIQRKCHQFRTILTIDDMVRRALAQHASFGESELEDLNEADVDVELPALEPSETLYVTQMGWTSVVGVRNHEVVAIAAKSDECDRCDPKIGYDHRDSQLTKR